MRYKTTPSEAAWSASHTPQGTRTFLQRWFFDLINPPDARLKVWGCPDCHMPIDEALQKSNIRVDTVEEEACYILSCPWCYRVMNIGRCVEVDAIVIVARKEPPDGPH